MESKNRFEVTFELITQSHDQGYNPTFESEVWWKVFREEKEPVILKRVSANGCACGFGKNQE